MRDTILDAADATFAPALVAFGVCALAAGHVPGRWLPLLGGVMLVALLIATVAGTVCAVRLWGDGVTRDPTLADGAVGSANRRQHDGCQVSCAPTGNVRRGGAA